MNPWLRILCVDDTPSVLRSMVQVLRDAGHTVETAPDSASARSLISQEPFDLVITDVQMPGESGVELLRSVADTRPGTRFMLMTGLDPRSFAREALGHSVRGFLQKPFSVDDLLDEVSVAMTG